MITKYSNYRNKNLTDSDLPAILQEAKAQAIEHLDLSKNHFTKIEFTISLPHLKVLDLSYNQSEVEQIIISGEYAELLYLYIYESQVKTVDFIQAVFPKLDTINLRKNQLSKVFKYQRFEALRVLNLAENQLQRIPPPFLNQMPKMEFLFLWNNPMVNPSPELFSQEEDVNVFTEIHSALISLQQGSIINTEAKVIWFGNGEVGKTTLSHQLREDEFQFIAKDDRTHGILQHKWELPLQEMPQAFQDAMQQAYETAQAENPQITIEKPDKVVLNMWDFGGQEYYHATHRLFLTNNVLYLLVWDEKSNKQDEEESIYPLEYWRENIHNNAPEHHIIEVQNKVEKGVAIQSDCTVQFRNETDNKSIKRYELDIEDLKEDILLQLQQLKHIGQVFPKMYHDIRGELRKLHQPYLQFQEYQEFCFRHDTSPDRVMEQEQEEQIPTFTNFLHESGAVICYRFHDKFKHIESLHNYVFVKPTWVTDTIYLILDKSLKDIGEFDLAHIQHKLPQGDALGASVWVDLMKTFELIFENSSTKKFIAPQYLPKECPEPKALKWALKANPQFAFCLHYPKFLSRSLFLRFITKYGTKSIDDLYWKKGLVFDLEGKVVHATCDYKKRNIRISIQDKDPKVAEELFNFFAEKANEQTQVSVDEKEFVTIHKLKERIEHNDTQIESERERYLNVEDFYGLFGKERKSLQPENGLPDTPKQKEIFFSYAWGDDKEEGESREKIVNELYDSLVSDGFNVTRDKVDLGYKGFISDFMMKIGQGEKVIVVLTEKYAKSPYCMFELYEVARNCKFDKAIFRDAVVPIKQEFIDFADPDILDVYLDYWEKEEEKWERLFQKRMGKLSTEQYSRYNKVKLISQNIAELMDWLADMNTLTKELLSKDGFEEIKKALNQ